SDHLRRRLLRESDSAGAAFSAGLCAGGAVRGDHAGCSREPLRHSLEIPADESIGKFLGGSIWAWPIRAGVDAGLIAFAHAVVGRRGIPAGFDSQVAELPRALLESSLRLVALPVFGFRFKRRGERHYGAVFRMRVRAVIAFPGVLRHQLPVGANPVRLLMRDL